MRSSIPALLVCLISGLTPVAAQVSVEPRVGDVLIASESLYDGNFGKTVVLLLAAGAEGSMGVVLNRRSLIPLATAIPDLEGVAERKDVVYWGGPVELGSSVLLVRASERPAGGEAVFDGVWRISDRAGLESLFSKGVEPGELRVYAGYAGWVPGQLEHELGRRDWYLRRARPEWVFAENADALWEELFDLARAKVASLQLR